MPKPIKDARSPYYQFDFQRNKRRFYGSTGCTSKRDAQQYIDNLVRQVALGHDHKKPITLDDACGAYWRDKGQHERSKATTEYQLANLCTIIGANRLLSEIGHKEFNDFIARRRGQGVSNSSINREWQLARRVWKHVAPDYEVANIDWGKLALDEPQERVRELTATEEKRLFDKLPDSLKPIVEFAILSGQRKSAVVGLRWQDIHWEQGEATIINKGGANHIFPLSPYLISLLLEQPMVDDCPYVFTYVCERHSPARKDRERRVKGKRYPFSTQGWDRKWRKAKSDAGVANFKFHDLRHTNATRIMRKTGNLKAAMRLLGHTDIRTTSRYAHVGMEDLRELMTETESRNNTGQRLTTDTENGSIPIDKEVQA